MILYVGVLVEMVSLIPIVDTRGLAWSSYLVFAMV